MSTEFDAIKLEDEAQRKVAIITVTGKLEKQDYEVFVPEVDRLIQKYGKIRMMVKLLDFHGWTAGALWEDTKFGAKHFNDIERLAIVGDSRWEKGMAVFCKVFTTAAVRYFDVKETDKARQWLEGADS